MFVAGILFMIVVIFIINLVFGDKPSKLIEGEDVFKELRNVPSCSAETWLALHKILKYYITSHRLAVDIVVISKSLDRSYELDYIIYDAEGLRGHTKLKQFIWLDNISDQSMEDLREHICDSNPYINFNPS